MSSLSRKLRGFTLIELLVVVAIIAVLVAILLPGLNTSRGTARQMTCMARLKSMGTAMGLYLNDHNDTYNHFVNLKMADNGEPINRALDPYITWALKPAWDWVPSAAWVCPSSAEADYPYGRPYCQNIGFTFGRFTGDKWADLYTGAWYGDLGGGRKMARLTGTTVRDPAGNIFMTEVEGIQWDTQYWGALKTWVVGTPWVPEIAAPGHPRPAYRHKGCASAVMVDGHCEPFEIGKMIDYRWWMLRE